MDHSFLIKELAVLLDLAEVANNKLREAREDLYTLNTKIRQLQDTILDDRDNNR